MKKDTKPQSSDFFTVEAYKLARTNISLSVFKQGCKCILFTSAQANEGKTTTVCNIAAAFSKQVNTSVLLIDCDLRKPSVSKFFRLNNAPGVTNYLSGMCGLNEIIQRVPNTELSVITAGLIPPNPSELLSSEAFSKMLDKLSGEFDYILIDTSPVNVVVDAVPVAKVCDGTVLVVYENKTNYQELDKAVDSLKRVGAHILGFVLNASKADGSRYQQAYRR